MTQWFRGNIEGYYMGQLDRAGSMGSAISGQTYRLLVYRAVIRDVELVEWSPPVSDTKSGAPASDPNSSGAASSGTGSAVPLAAGAAKADASSALNTSAAAASEGDTQAAPVQLPPWLPARGTSFFQPTITDARLFPVRHTAGWYEGPVHQVFIEDFRATHSKQSGKRLYGRFVGKVQAYFAMPEAPRPVAAERILQAFQEVPEEEHPPVVEPEPHPTSKAAESLDARLNAVARAQEALTAAPGASDPSSSKAAVEAVLESSQGTHKTPDARPTSKKSTHWRAPLLILVLLVAAALLLTCGAGRAVLWLLFLLPTLLVRRILRDVIPDSTLVSALSALLTLGQVWIAGMIFVGWWETGCRDMHALPLIGILTGLVVACVLPSDVPFLVNMSSLAALLFGWCTARGEECNGVGRNTHTSAQRIELCAGAEVRVEQIGGSTYPAVTESLQAEAERS